MLSTLNITCANRFRSLSGGPRHWLFAIFAITVPRSQESASEHEARLIPMPRDTGRRLPHLHPRYPVDVDDMCFLAIIDLFSASLGKRRPPWSSPDFQPFKRPILHIGWFISMLTDLAGPRFGGCVTSQCFTIETHSQTGTVRYGDDSLLVGRDRPVEQLGS